MAKDCWYQWSLWPGFVLYTCSFWSCLYYIISHILYEICFLYVQLSHIERFESKLVRADFLFYLLFSSERSAPGCYFWNLFRNQQTWFFFSFLIAFQPFSTISLEHSWPFHSQSTYLLQSVQRQAVLLKPEILFSCRGMEKESLKTKAVWAFWKLSSY